MNATTPHPSSPSSVYQDAKIQFENVKKSFDSTWSNTQAALEFLGSIIHRQTQRIRSLEARTNVLETELSEKTKRVEELREKMKREDYLETVSETVRSYEEQLAQKQRQLDESETRNAALVDAANRGNAMLAEARQRADISAKLHAQTLSQVALAKTPTSAQDSGQGQRTSGDKEKFAKIEAALKEELEARSDAVRRAATAVAQEASELNAKLHARVSTLEEQLQTSRSVVEKLTKAQEHWTIKPPSTSARSGTPHRIVAGTYRPKPLPPPNPTAPQQSPDTPSSNDPSSAHRVPPRSTDSPASSTRMPTGEVMDLTLSPGELELDSRSLDAPPAKRQRVESDVLMRSASPSLGISSASHQSMQQSLFRQSPPES